METWDFSTRLSVIRPYGGGAPHPYAVRGLQRGRKGRGRGLGVRDRPAFDGLAEKGGEVVNERSDRRDRIAEFLVG